VSDPVVDSRRWENLFGGGLWSEEHFVASNGLQFRGVRVTRILPASLLRMNGPNTYWVQWASEVRTRGLTMPTYRVYANGWFVGTSVRNGMLVRIDDGPLFDLRVEDGPPSRAFEWHYNYPNTVTLQWAGVPDASYYQVLDGELLLATIPDAGKPYYTYTPPALTDGDQRTYTIRAYNANHVASDDLELDVTMVTTPTDDPVDFSYDAGTGELTISQS